MRYANVFICSILLTSTMAMATDDPEMNAIDMTPAAGEAPLADIDKVTLLEATAKVTAIDMDNRMVTIEDPEGNSMVIQVTDQVKNLPQVRIGDVVNATYYRSAIASIVVPGESEKPELGTIAASSAMATAPAGQKPAGALGVQITRRAEVVFVDPYQKFISFRSPDRGLRKITLKDRPDLQHYLHELKEGDIVEVTYTEAVAIALEPAE
jgi:hypothetical protein